ALEDAGIEIGAAEIQQRPKTTVEVDAETATKLLRLIDVLEDNDDVDAVHANFDAPVEVLERIAAG
ncbi:MAG: YebC/PmpR family DNA-binding transcriptional regulator, partial [Solirubrobacteraceae bacterium]